MDDQKFAEPNLETSTNDKQKTKEKLPKLKASALVIVVAVIGYLLWQGLTSIPLRPDPSATPTISATFTVIPSTKTMTPVPTETIIPTPTLGIVSTMTGEHGEILMYVPAGKFTMGSDYLLYEEPIHTIYLDAFWIDQTEVTNKQYRACVRAGTCERPSSFSSYTHPNYYRNPEFNNYPVVYVSWDKAKRYCEFWAGGDLPTEAQWEKAARGTDGRTYPWGEGIDCDKANYNGRCGDDTSPVGNYESGKSPYNVYDMVGNVWEWVNDYYQNDYYALLGDNVSNPLGPESGQFRVLRGNSWRSMSPSARPVFRIWVPPTYTMDNYGFRCSRSQ